MLLAFIAGVFTAGATVAVVEMLGHSAVEGQAVFGVAILGLAVAAFVGGMIAAMISKVSEFAYIIAGVLAILSLVNVFSFKHPSWFVPAAIISLGAGALLAIRLHKSKGKT